MADPFYGEIRLFCGNFVPVDWLLCDGSVLQIQQYHVLFAVIGNKYGGDGKTTFALPNLNGRVAMHQGSGTGLTPRVIAESDGAAQVTLQIDEMPFHTHAAMALQATGTTTEPANAVWAQLYEASDRDPQPLPQYVIPTTATSNNTMAPDVLMPNGGNLPHNNMQPYLPLHYIICTAGEYPMRP